MNPWRASYLMTMALILLSDFFQYASAGFLAKDLLIAYFIGQVLKPRFKPVIIPIPLPLKFHKHTHKPYPVPIYSHSLSAHQVGHNPYSASSSQNLVGHHGFATSTSSFPSEKQTIKLHSSSDDIGNLIDDLDLNSEYIHGGTSHVDSVHDDIEAIGGIDVLTDLDGLGEDHKWW